MSMKVDGSNAQSLSCEPEVATSTAQALAQQKPLASVDSLEQARVQERAFAGERGLVEEQLYRALKQVPQPGAAELEVSAKLLHAVGGKLSVTADREANGDYLVRVAGKGTLGVPYFVASGEARAEGATTMRFRTPEAAADYLATLATSAPAPMQALVQGDALPRVGHYAAQHLARVELSGELGLHVAAELTVAYGALDATGRATAMVDLERNALVIEQGLSGEAVGRASMVLARVGAQAEVALKARSEVWLPREQLEALAAGRLSLGDVLASTEHRWQFIAEGKALEEVGTLFAGAPSAQQKLELVFEPGALLDEDPATTPLHGERTFLWTKDKALSTGADVPGFNFLVRGAIYDVSKQPLIEHHGAHALQSELDGRRALSP